MLGNKESISTYITYEEATASATATEHGIDNNVYDPLILRNMVYVATSCFDTLREFAGAALGVNSFFRSKELNKKVRGSSTSQHLDGSAIDVDADKYKSCTKTNAQLFAYALVNLKFDQIIYEKPKDENDILSDCSWVHISSEPKRQRGKVTIFDGNSYRDMTEAEKKEIVERHYHNPRDI